MLAKRRRQSSSEGQASQQVGADMGFWVDSSVDIDTHLLPQWDRRLPILQVTFFHQHKITECQLVVIVVGDQSLLRWTLLTPIGGKPGAMT